MIRKIAWRVNTIIMDTADYISVMLQCENVIGPRPDRTTVTLIREIYRFSIKKVHRRTEIIKSDMIMKDKRLLQKTDKRIIITLKSPAITNE